MATSNRVKKLIRARMVETGEKYTAARRAILEQHETQIGNDGRVELKRSDEEDHA